MHIAVQFQKDIYWYFTRWMGGSLALSKLSNLEIVV